MNLRPTFSAGAFALAVLGLAQFAPAKCSACGHGGYGFQHFYHSDRQIPYFAEFPPVYYSVPVPRTYGYSPYAYPSSVMTPEVEVAPTPETILNPHVAPPKAPADGKKKAASNKTAMVHAGPQVVLNPYVDGSKPVAQASYRE